MTSLKKLIAVLAVTLPLAAKAQAPATPPAPLYQWYGTLNLNAQYIEVSGPTQAGAVLTNPALGNMSGRFAISTDSSNVGIRGTADTGQFGLGVVYQCETSANLDGEGVSGICNRNSRIGLSSGWGTLFYGNWDTPYKAAAYGTKADDPFGNTDVYDLAGIIGSPGFKTRSSGAATAATQAAMTANTRASFNVRAANSIAYHSPKFEGAQLKAQYSVNEFQNSNGDIAPAVYSVALNYDRGPFSVFAAWERHDDWAGYASNVTTIGVGKSTQDMGVKVGAGIELASGVGMTTIGGQFEWLQYKISNPDTAAGSFDNATRNAYTIGLKHRMGNHELRARFAQAMDLSIKATGGVDTSAAEKNTGAMMYTLGYAYHLSKAAQLYAYGTKIENDDAATYTFATGGPAQLTAAGAEAWLPGADPFAVGLGMRYAF